MPGPSPQLRWEPSATLSLIRMMQRLCHGLPGQAALGAVEDEVLSQALQEPVDSITTRLLSTPVQPSDFWSRLLDEIAANESGRVTAGNLEVALLGAGDSKLQSDQTAASLERDFSTAVTLVQARLPRQSDQLRLRYAPMRQAYEAYAPGLIRQIGNRVWNGQAPDDWWPSPVTVYAVSPLVGGAADVCAGSNSVWIEAMLTDVSPLVPEWLRLVYTLAILAVEQHTRSHASSASTGDNPLGLPWSVGLVPLILEQAAILECLPRLPEHVRDAHQQFVDTVAEALRLWNAVTPRDVISGIPTEVVAEVIANWWLQDAGDQAMPQALRQLLPRLSAMTEVS
ncbi:MAG: hypothetical protein AAGD07_01420 [Planctomycetota bacterium]